MAKYLKLNCLVVSCFNTGNKKDIYIVLAIFMQVWMHECYLDIFGFWELFSNRFITRVLCIHTIQRAPGHENTGNSCVEVPQFLNGKFSFQKYCKMWCWQDWFEWLCHSTFLKKKKQWNACKLHNQHEIQPKRVQNAKLIDQYLRKEKALRH